MKNVKLKQHDKEDVQYSVDNDKELFCVSAKLDGSQIDLLTRSVERPKMEAFCIAFLESVQSKALNYDCFKVKRANKERLS